MLPLVSTAMQNVLEEQLTVRRFVVVTKTGGAHVSGALAADAGPASPATSPPAAIATAATADSRPLEDSLFGPDLVLMTLLLGSS
ncbi:MAG: hypothetical protein ACRDY1_14315, partial [Acidimicrobiales bacterium]